MANIGMAQYGTKHAHAQGKIAAMLANPDVEFAGVYEPDPDRRRTLEGSDGPFQGIRWFGSEDEMLEDSRVMAVASEGDNAESLAQTEATVRAGKHVWYDKPAGVDWQHWQRVQNVATEKGLAIQMGYMFRYHDGFRRIAEWAQSGLLGTLFAIRGHMSTCLDEDQRNNLNRFPGGVCFDLLGHLLDQIVWLLGRPEKITSFLRHDGLIVPGFIDNTLIVFEFDKAMAYVDIAATEAPPAARRFEVYGSLGSAIMEPLEPRPELHLCLKEARDGFAQGRQTVPVPPQPRQEQYDRELSAFVATIQGRQNADRPSTHDSTVQEALLRAVGNM